MNGERIRLLRLHLLCMLLLTVLILLLSPVRFTRAQDSKQTETQKLWTGKLIDGRVITQADLDEILRSHALWLKSLRSNFKEGKRANLSGADLSGADLSADELEMANLNGARLLMAKLSGASLKGANLKNADLSRADLSGAELEMANLNGARLFVAKLNGASLKGANLKNADLLAADLRGVNLSKADLYGANLREAYLERAILSEAILSETDLSDANLSGAFLNEANLSGAYLSRANLRGTVLWFANLSGVHFEPKPGSVSDVTLLLNIKGLSLLRYDISSHGLVELREAYKKAELREPERQVTYALNHTRRIKLWEKPGLPNKVESLFNLVCFEWPCQYGMNPGRPLTILVLGLFLFTPFYLLALRSRKQDTGVWVLPMPDRVLDRDIKDRPIKLTFLNPFLPSSEDRGVKFRGSIQRYLGWLWVAFYFSLLSAFNLGWRELNVGNWISRLQKREYTLRATGWPRTVAGLQSLLSVYLLALWVLTYFGRPFE